jgi:hypothetical protein
MAPNLKTHLIFIQENGDVGERTNTGHECTFLTFFPSLKNISLQLQGASRQPSITCSSGPCFPFSFHFPFIFLNNRIKWMKIQLSISAPLECNF